MEGSRAAAGGYYEYSDRNRKRTALIAPISDDFESIATTGIHGAGPYL